MSIQIIYVYSEDWPERVWASLKVNLLFFYASSELFFRIEFLTARDQIICDKTNEMAYVDAQAN